jgi:hypothetical protein
MTKNPNYSASSGPSSKRSDAEVGLIALRASLAKMHSGGVGLEFTNTADGLTITLRGYRADMGETGKVRIDIDPQQQVESPN